MPSTQLKKLSTDEVTFGFSYLYGGPVMLLGGALVAASPHFADENGKLFGYALGGLMVLLGLLTALRRYELRFDLRARTWHRRAGYWPSIETASGPLSDLVAVSRHTSLGTRDEGGVKAKYRICLTFAEDAPGWEKEVNVLKTSSFPAAEELQQKLARALGVPATDP